MSTYFYRARDASGKAVKGTMNAETKDILISKLRKMGYMATQVTETRGMAGAESFFERIKPISAESMIIFNVQLSNMINAGVSILESLAILSDQLENKKLRDAVSDIKRNVESGDSFSQALARHPRIFSKLFVNMVKAGEASGKLDTVLMRYAEFSENQADLKQKIQGALFYPIVLLCAGVTVMLFIVTFVIPQFAGIFAQSGIALPLPTLILYKTGLAIKRLWYVLFIFCIASWMAVKYYIKTDRGRLNIDRFKLKMPIFGALQRKAALSRFARTLGTLTASGVPILESLDITKDVVGNEVLTRVIIDTRRSVEKGERIASSLKVSEEFPQDTVQMIAVGEETGNLETMLNKISDFYEKSLGYTIKKITTILEPLFLLIMGSMVGFIMASMLLPIFDMIKTLKR